MEGRGGNKSDESQHVHHVHQIYPLVIYVTKLWYRWLVYFVLWLPQVAICSKHGDVKYHGHPRAIRNIYQYFISRSQLTSINIIYWISHNPWNGFNWSMNIAVNANPSGCRWGFPTAMAVRQWIHERWGLEGSDSVDICGVFLRNGWHKLLLFMAEM